jgi:flagellar motor switch protein FliM
MVQIVAPNEVVVVIGFEIKVGSRAGTMSICLPFNVIEPVVGKLATQSWQARPGLAGAKGEVRRVTRTLHRADVDLRAYLGETRMTVADLLSLAPGDVIKLEKLVERDFVVRIEGRNKFAGRLGKLRGNRALQITRGALPEESL